MRIVLTGALAALMMVAGFSAPVLAEAEDMVVEGAWSRASIGTSRPGVAYMTIHNAGDEAVRLIGIRTDLAKRSEIHRSSINDQGVSSMEPAGEVEIAPGDTVALEPGGLHAMLVGLQRPMAEGNTFSLTLVFSDGGEVMVEVPIFGITARGPGG